MNIPFRSDAEIEHIAQDFLRQHCPETLEPTHRAATPIELIVERNLDMEIVLFRGYRDRFNVDGSISTDLTNITVDEYVFERVPNRFRFTLAHEIGHRVLHSDIIRELEVDSTEHWREQRLSIPPAAHRRMEIQASEFAGRILVPTQSLMSALNEAKDKLAAGSDGLDPEELTFSSLSWIAGWVAKRFEVSTRVAEIRMQKL